MSHIGVVLFDLDDECGGGFRLQRSFEFSDPRIGFSSLWHDSPTPGCAFGVTIDCRDRLPAFVRIAVAIGLLERRFGVDQLEGRAFAGSIDRMYFDFANDKISKYKRKLLYEISYGKRALSS